jgi:hypothetical protein
MLKKDVEDMDMDEFVSYLAKARYIQELEETIQSNAIARVFAKDGEQL